MGNWWKRQIIRNSIVISPFIKGDIVLAKNGEEFITLYDGKGEVTTFRKDIQNLKLVRRLNPKETDLIKRDYQCKRAFKLIWDPSIIVG